MNIVIVGLGKFGREITRHLSDDNHNIICIDNKEEIIGDVVNEFDCMGYVGNGASYKTLEEANVKNFDLLIATTGVDEVNILSCLIAKSLGIKQTIARVRNPEYDCQFDVITNVLGIDLTLNPDLDTAREIYRILRFPSALKVESFGEGNGSVDIIEFKVDKDSLLVNLSLSEIQEKYEVKLLVCAVERNGNVTIPKGDFILNESDHIYVIFDKVDAPKTIRKLKLSKTKFSTTIIVGGGKISYYLTGMLLDNGMSVKVFEKDKKISKTFSEQRPDAMVLNADGTNQNLLIEEGLEDSSIVALTGVDETNIVVSSYAKSINCKKVITKVSSTNYGSMLNSIGLDTIISPKAVFATNVIRYIRNLESSRFTECKGLYRLVENKVEALEFGIVEKTNYTSVPLKNLKIKSGYIIAAIIRNGEVIIPGGNDYLELNDSVIIVTTRQNTIDLSEIVE